MSTYRTIEPSLFDNSDLLRLGLVAQWCFAYLIGKGADDEGRFEWDPFIVLRNAFSPVDGVTLEQVSGAMDGLADAGMTLRYADGQYGFLTGWFEHQRIARAYRVESKLPRPPVKVATWEEAEAAKVAYCKQTGADPKRSSYRNAVRWALQGSLPESRRVLQESGKTSTKNPSQGSKGEVEGKGRTTTLPQLEDTDTAPDDGAALGQAKKQRQDTQGQAAIRAAFEALTGEPLPKALPGYAAAEKLVTEYGLPMVREWMEFLRGEEPGVPEGANAWAHFKTTFRRAMNRDFEWRRKQSAVNGPREPTKGLKLTNWGDGIVERRAE